MESQAYLGKGLSLPQLMFALNAELNSMAHSSSLTLDQLSQVAKDISTASIAIRELRNSLVPVNLLPLDILLLIPTNLTSQSDRLQATFVCRHWRRAFVEHAPLWSQLSVVGGKDRHLLATLLKRVRKHPLDITLRHGTSSICDVILLSSFAQRIRNLTVNYARPDHIQDLSVALSEPLPLLHTLSIDYNGYDCHPSGPRYNPTLFEGAVNVTKFILNTCDPTTLPRFSFLNLVTFRFYTPEEVNQLPISLLLDFLGALPLLQDLDITTGSLSFNTPPDRVVVLPCVKDFCLRFSSNSHGWGLVTHLSCPSAERVGFGVRPMAYDYNFPGNIYPPSFSWRAIIRQYTIGAADEVELRLEVGEDFTCTIVFRSSSRTTLELNYDHLLRESYYRGAEFNQQIWSFVFSRASKTIQDYPLLANVKRLRIQGGGLLAGDLPLAANDVGRLLGSMGPLERLELCDCDLRPFLDPFHETPPAPDAVLPILFPFTKKFAIVNPIQSLCDNEAYAAAVVKLAKSQHAKGVPFEDVTLRPSVPSWVVEELLLSVNTVECGEVVPGGDGGQN